MMAIQKKVVSFIYLQEDNFFINRDLNSAPPFHHSSRLSDEEKCSKQQKINRGLNSARPFHHSSRLHDEEKCSKQQEIDRLKEELGRISKVLTNLEQECLELRKDREKNEKHLKSALPVNESKDAESFCTKKPNLKNKDLSEDTSIIHPGHIGVGVQTDEVAISTELTIKKNPSKKLTGIWEAGNILFYFEVVKLPSSYAISSICQFWPLYYFYID